MKNMKYSKKTILGVAIISVMFVSFSLGMILNDVVYDNVTLEEAVEHYTESWKVCATNISVGNTDTGIVNMGTYTHQSSPYTLYDDGLTESNFYEHMDLTPTCGEELLGTTPYSTLFDVVVIVQWGYAEAYNTSSSAWEKGLVKAYINITSTDTEMNAVTSEVMLEGDFYDIDGTNDALMNMYVVGTGGFDLGQNVVYTINNIKLYYFG